MKTFDEDLIQYWKDVNSGKLPKDKLEFDRLGKLLGEEIKADLKKEHNNETTI
jgi:glutamine synthetase adenylyltransferase